MFFQPQPELYVISGFHNFRLMYLIWQRLSKRSCIRMWRHSTLIWEVSTSLWLNSETVGIVHWYVDEQSLIRGLFLIWQPKSLWLSYSVWPQHVSIPVASSEQKSEISSNTCASFDPFPEGTKRWVYDGIFTEIVMFDVSQSFWNICYLMVTFVYLRVAASGPITVKSNNRNRGGIIPRS